VPFVRQSQRFAFPFSGDMNCYIYLGAHFVVSIIYGRSDCPAICVFETANQLVCVFDTASKVVAGISLCVCIVCVPFKNQFSVLAGISLGVCLCASCC
jgi:hypothetical protein